MATPAVSPLFFATMMTIEQLNQLIDDQTVKNLEKLKTQQKPRAYWEIVNALLHFFGRANVPPMQVCTFIHECVRAKPEDADRHYEFISAADDQTIRDYVERETAGFSEPDV